MCYYMTDRKGQRKACILILVEGKRVKNYMSVREWRISLTTTNALVIIIFPFSLIIIRKIYVTVSGASDAVLAVHI